MNEDETPDDEISDEEFLIGDDPDELTPRELKKIQLANALPNLKRLAAAIPKLSREDKIEAWLLFEAAEKIGCELSLSKFFRCAWSQIDTSPYQHNWHIDIVSAEAEKLVTGECRNLLVNMPPRMGKSLLLTVILPVWIWIQSEKGPMSGPHIKFMTASYGQSLSFEHSNICRKLILSPWFQKHWGKNFQLREDRNSIGYFENDKGGYRFSTSVGAGLTGRGADCVAEGTLISTPGGLKNVEDIKVGDLVYGLNHEKNERVEAKVLATRSTNKIVRVVVETASTQITCTPEHPFFCPQRKIYVQAKDLCVGDYVLTQWGPHKITAHFFSSHGVSNFYDIQVERVCNFFANGILVHNCILVDDPANTQDVLSEAERTSVINWYSQALSTRLNDPRTGVKVLVMQRQHEEDLTGYILENEADFWTHIVFRMRYESNPYLPYDPRETEGELLWPSRMPENEVQKLETTLGSIGTAGQLQQRPTTKGGEIIKARDWQMFPPPGEEDEWIRDGKLCWPPVDFIIASLDGAYTEKESNDPSALTVWGIWRNRFGMPKVIAMHAWEDFLSFNPLVNRTAAACKKFKVDVLLIEAKASGISVGQEIRRVYGAAEWTTILVPVKGDKVARAIAVQGLFEEGCILAPDRAWAQLLIDRCASFPMGKRKDLVDSTTQALKWLRENGMIQRKDERSREVFDALPRPGAIEISVPYDV